MQYKNVWIKICSCYTRYFVSDYTAKWVIFGIDGWLRQAQPTTACCLSLSKAKKSQFLLVWSIKSKSFIGFYSVNSQNSLLRFRIKIKIIHWFLFCQFSNFENPDSDKKIIDIKKGPCIITTQGPFLNNKRQGLSIKLNTRVN